MLPAEEEIAPIRRDPAENNSFLTNSSLKSDGTCDKLNKKYIRSPGHEERQTRPKTMKTSVYLASVRPLEDEALYGQLRSLASEERRKKADRFRFAGGRRLSLGAEALLRVALLEAGMSGTPLRYAYGKNGKPYLTDAPGFFFNLSHAGEYVMAAVSDAEIGCDIEMIRPVHPRLPRHVLTAEEAERFASADEAERDALFTRYLTLKESYMKALGEGLARNPASFCIELGPPIRVLCGGTAEDYGFVDWDDLPGYRYAVCRAGTGWDAEKKNVCLEEAIQVLS